MNETDKKLAHLWFQKADNDLLSARNNLASKEIPADVVCFHCQQVAEKYLKGFLAWHAQPFRKTHNLIELVEMATDIEQSVIECKEHVISLNEYGVDGRYPAGEEMPTIEEAQKALETAVAIRDILLRSLKNG